jgi:hypothetical protein
MKMKEREAARNALNLVILSEGKKSRDSRVSLAIIGYWKHQSNILVDVSPLLLLLLLLLFIYFFGGEEYHQQSLAIIKRT